MNFFRKIFRGIIKQSVWARPKMPITFRAEVMPGKSRVERTFRIDKVLPNGRITLQNFAGEHRESSFEPIDFEREKS